MGKDAYLYALADRPFGRVRLLASADLLHELMAPSMIHSGWYLVHFEAQGSLTLAVAALANITDVRSWIQAANPTWRDRFDDLLQQINWNVGYARAQGP